MLIKLKNSDKVRVLTLNCGSVTEVKVINPSLLIIQDFF